MADPRGPRHLNGDDEWTSPQIIRKVLRSETEIEHLARALESAREEIAALREELRETRDKLHEVMLSIALFPTLRNAVFGFIVIAITALLTALFRGVLPGVATP